MLRMPDLAGVPASHAVTCRLQLTNEGVQVVLAASARVASPCCEDGLDVASSATHRSMPHQLGNSASALVDRRAAEVAFHDMEKADADILAMAPEGAIQIAWTEEAITMRSQLT
jgi:hypothetical protein